MYYPQIALTIDGTFWKVSNPYLTAATSRPQSASSHTPLYAATSAVATGAILCPAALMASAAAPTAFTVAAIGAAAAGGGVFAWLERRSSATTKSRQHQQQSLESTVGTPTLTRAELTEPGLRMGGDRAVRAAQIIAASTAFTHGTLGDPDAIGQDVQYALWDIVHALVDLDERSRDYRRAESSIADHQREQDIQIAGAVRGQLGDDAVPVFDQVTVLEDLADKALQLDARLAGPEIDQSLAHSLRPTRHGVDSSALDRVAASVAAAGDILDAEGLE